jgi:hypothetical protein
VGSITENVLILPFLAQDINYFRIMIFLHYVQDMIVNARILADRQCPMTGNTSRNEAVKKNSQSCKWWSGG